MEKSKDNFRQLSSGLIVHLIFLKQILSLVWSSPRRLCWLASQSRGSASPALRSQACAAMQDLFYVVAGD